MKYCPNCKQAKSSYLNLCDVCLGPLEALPSSEAASELQALEPVAPQLPPPIPPQPQPPPRPAPRPQSPPQSPPLQPPPPEEQPAPRPQPTSEPSPFLEVPERTLSSAIADYDKVAADIRRKLEQGFDLFCFVGHSGSGKTHCVKALTHILDRQGLGGTKARIEMLKSPVPEATQADDVFDYTYRGNGQKWIFVDAAGELYRRIQENDWDVDPEVGLKLTAYLHQCKGLFMFLKVDRGHLRRRSVDLDETIHPGALEERRKAFDARREIDFFRDFLLFLRALKVEDGNVRRVVEKCRRSRTLEEALIEYDRSPRLEIPVMFFFSQADSFEEKEFEIAGGIHMNPRRLPIPTAAFAARYLPSLFNGISSQVRRFKFDFLQSYEEEMTTDLAGDPTRETHFCSPSTDETPLSVGLLSGVEFVLRNQTSGRPWWKGPGLPPRQALLLHRLFNPAKWKDVDVDLGSFWRAPRLSEKRGAQE